MKKLTGQILGQYRLMEPLGSGGMGMVYRAYQPSLGREVAIKVLSQIMGPDSLRRFKIEAQTAATLQHPHILQIYDFNTEGELSYVVMPLLTGGSLRDRLDRHNSRDTYMSFKDVIIITRQVSSGLDYAHSKGVIHRDIKPANILFDDKGIPYITDFGVAKLMHSRDASLTTTGNIVGTLSYVAPDPLRGEDVTPAADQYSLAVTVYEMLTGELPYSDESPLSLIRQRLYDDPTPPQTHRPDLSEGIIEVIWQGLAKTPEERFPTVTAFAQALEAAVRRDTAAIRTIPQKKDIMGDSPSIPAAKSKEDSQLRKPSGKLVRFLVLMILGIGLGVVTVQTGLPTQMLHIIQPTTTPWYDCTVNARIGVNLRYQPNLEAEIYDTTTQNWQANVTGKAADADERIWWRVRIDGVAEDLWIADEFAGETGDCEAVQMISVE